MNSPEVDFVERSICILKENEQFRNDMSIIINCTYGLLSFPHLMITREKCEEKKNNPNWWMDLSPWNEDITDSPSVRDIIKGDHPKSLGELIEAVRNGLNHQPFVPDNKSGKFVGIKINLTTRKKGEPELKWSFDATQDQLKNFLLMTADKYLEYFKNLNKTN
jgi:hypothetical protein